MTTQTKTTWQKVKLEEIVDFQYGYTASAQDVDTGTKLLRITDIVPDLIDWDVVPYCAIDEKKLEQFKIKKGDILIARTGATAGYAKLIRRAPEQSVFASYLIRLVMKNKNISPDFIGRIIESDAFKNFVSTHAGGSAQPHANTPVLKNFEIFLPDLLTQNQIADVLSAYDDLIENNTKRIKILEEIAQAIYREWFVSFRFPGHEKVKIIDSKTEFGKIPEGWVVKKISDICTKIQAGGTPRRGKDEYWGNGTIDWYTTGELRDNFLFDSKEKITEQSIDETSAKVFDKGTTLMAIYGSPTVGRLGITTKKSSCNQAALGLVADDRILTQTYLFYILKNLRDKFNAESVGAAQQNISKIKVSETDCLVADKNVIDIFDSVASPVFQDIENIQEQNIKLRQARDLLLSKLVGGEIRV